MLESSRRTESRERRYFTEADRRAFDRDGFVVVRSLCEPGETARLARSIDDLAGRDARRGGPMIYLEDSLLQPGARILSRIEKFADLDGPLRDLVADPRILGRVAEIFAEPAVLFKEKINFKLPGCGGFEAHQDMQPGWDAYAARFLSVLITIDESTSANGCLELAAGHHERGLIGEKWKPLQGAELDGVDFVEYPTGAGDAVFFDAYVPHRSCPNLSDSPRRNLYLTYNPVSLGDHRERYFADKRKSYPPDNEREPGKEYRFRV